MITVLIVDDEPTMRQGMIRKIDWEALQMECAGEAGDGVEALEMAAEMQPDIILADIRMPEMDGLTLIGKVKEQFPRIKCVIVSGYNDFNYAHQAIRHGVTDYLLKPVDDGKLFQLLQKLSAELAAEQEEQARYQLLLKHYGEYRDTHREHVWTRLVDGIGNESDLREAEESHQGRLAGVRQWLAAVISIEPFALPHCSFRPGDEHLVRFSISNIVEERMNGADQPCVLFRHARESNNMVLLLGCQGEQPVHYAKKRIAYALTGIREYLRLEGTAGIGEPIARLSDIHKSYRQAMSALKTRVVRGAGNVYEHADIRHHSHKVESISGEEERLLMAYLNDGKEEELMGWLTDRFHKLTSGPHVTHHHVERLYIDLDAIFRKYLMLRTSEPELILDETNDLIPLLTNLRHWQEALDEVKRNAASILRFDRERGCKSGYEIVAEVKQVMVRSYHENLTLNWVAGRYFIHPNYFSKLFKEQCGENFNDFLTRIRLSHAVELLKDPGLKVGRIAELIGYKDSTYFSSVFKKVYEMTPLQYREQIRSC